MHNGNLNSFKFNPKTNFLTPAFFHKAHNRLMSPIRVYTSFYFYGLATDCSNSIANALELLQSCIKPSICGFKLQPQVYFYFIALFSKPCCIFPDVLRVYGSAVNLTFRSISYSLYLCDSVNWYKHMGAELVRLTLNTHFMLSCPSNTMADK